MTQDFDRLVESWLEETASPIADPIHIYPAVAADVAHRPQHRRRLHLPDLGRYGSMFSLTKFVGVGAIVALFGGFLLTAVSTQQGEETLPAVGASASASPRTTDDLLSRLDTREVMPGVSKIIGDGTSRGMAHVQTISVEDDGTVWMAASDGIYELGGSERHPGIPGYGSGFLASAEDGTVWAAQEYGSEGCCEGERRLSLRSFDGQRWAQRSGSPLAAGSEMDPRWPPGYLHSFAVHPDGTAWMIGEKYGDNPHGSVLQLGPDGWTIHDFPDGTGRGEGLSLAITPAGTVWLGVEGVGLLRFDGTSWEPVRPLGGDEDHGVVSLAAGQDDVLWVELRTADTFDGPLPRLGEGRLLARFDGESWDVFFRSPSPDLSYTPDSDYGGPSFIEAVGADGSVWLTDTYPDPETRGGYFPVSFDGEHWRRYPEVLEHWASEPVFELGECCIGAWHITTAPDGAAWVNIDPEVGKDSHGGVYVITPDATAVIE